MIIYKNLEEIELVKKSALLVSKTLGELKKYIFPGTLPIDLDKIAETFIRDHGGEPGFLGMYGFPNSLCISINEEVVHGIPGNKPLKNGDIISIDCGVLMNEYYGDHAYTFTVGEVKEDIKKLLEITKESLYKGIEKLKVGNIYINRDMVGAVVGSQPFGGVGLSGSGFKAGGPNYLLQFLNEKVVSKNSVAFGGNTELLNIQEDVWLALKNHQLK